MKNTYHGSCLCGGIRFRVDGFGALAANCHCSMCRKFHGAAFGTLVSVSGLEWLSGVELLKDFTAPNGTTRTFCLECGSSIGFRSRNASVEDIELAIGTFDVDIPITIDAQIYTRYKANWSTLQSGLADYSDGRES